MAKLKCDRHKLRVHVIRGRFLHRGGWGAVCESPTASIGEATYTAKEIEEVEKVRQAGEKHWLLRNKKDADSG